jgi:D-serine deaminase-like pyridoxal phosphate-dependent protein
VSEDVGLTVWRTGILGQRDILTPSVVVCGDQARRNIDGFASRAAAFGVGVFPHWKGHKTKELAGSQIMAGCAGLEVAKMSEVQLLVHAGVDTNIVLAWVWRWPTIWTCAAQLAADGVNLTVDVDSEETIDGYEQAAAPFGSTIAVRLQVNAGLRGASPEQVRGLAHRVQASPHLNLVALTCYRGMYLSSGDRDPRPFDVLGAEEAQLLVSLAADLNIDIGRLDIVCGSTATAWGAARTPGVTDVAGGAYALGDWSLARLGVIDSSTIAAAVVTTVLHVSGGKVVFDAGSDVLGNEHHYPGLQGARASTPDGSVVVEQVGPSTSCGIVRHGRRPSVGDRILLIPSRIYSTVACPGQFRVVDDNGDTVDEWRRHTTMTMTEDDEVALAAAQAADGLSGRRLVTLRR